jgi:uncharacterized protein YndB with AHSA1/START domain
MAPNEFKAPPGTPQVIANRIINDRRKVVFRTVSDPLMIPKWWRPSKFEAKAFAMADVPVGKWRTVQQDQEGKEFGLHGFCQEVSAANSLVSTSESEVTPGYSCLAIEKFDEQDGKTIIPPTTFFQLVKKRDHKV